MQAEPIQEFAVEVVPISQLKPHPRNYRRHPPDEIEHLKASIAENGIYRNVVVANDYTLLAGHGVIQAMMQLERTHAPVHRLDIGPDDPRAIKVLVADNEIAHLTDSDDRLLSELLRQIKDEAPTGLIGTGYDSMMLANLIMVTRPASEIQSVNEAAEWAGMPEFISPNEPLKAIVAFDTEEDRADFAQRLGLPVEKITKSMWWPYREREDLANVRVVQTESESGVEESTE
jgi:hypothetical protein